MKIIEDGADVVSSSNAYQYPLEHGRQFDGTTLTYKNFADVYVILHEAAERSVVDSADLNTDGIKLEQHFHATGNARNDSVMFPP